MTWPVAPNCHASEWMAQDHAAVWSPQRVDGGIHEGFRRCSYCGSVCAEDLVTLVQAGKPIQLHGADWKYGWPHKFYVQGLPNLTPGQPHVFSRQWQGEKLIAEESRPSPQTLTAKFYNRHLFDSGYGEKELELLLAVLSDRGGIEFELRGGGNIAWKQLAHYQG